MLECSKGYGFVVKGRKRREAGEDKLNGFAVCKRFQH